MGNFEALITARLDASQAQAQLDALTKPKTVDIKLNFTTGSGTNGINFSTGIQQQMKAVSGVMQASGQQAGQAFANAMNGQMANVSQAINTNIEKITLSMRNSTQGAAKASAKAFSQLDAQIASNKTLAWLNKNSAASKKYGDILTDLAQKQRNAFDAKELAQYNKQVKFYQSQAQADGLMGKSWGADLRNGLAQVAKFASAYQIIQRLMWQTPREMIQAVQDIDAANIELRKVSDASSSDITQYFDEATESAKRYGVAVSDVIQSTADWSRLGYDFKQAKELSDATTLLQRVGDNMTQETASKGIISALQGFQLDVGDVGHIVDAYNEVANNFAIDTEGIAEAVERSASSMTAAGNTMEETIALATAANKVVQDPASIGTSFKTISMRIRGEGAPIYTETYNPPLKRVA